MVEKKKNVLKKIFNPNRKKGIVFIIITILSLAWYNLRFGGCCSCCPPWAQNCIMMCCPCYNLILMPYQWIVRPAGGFFSDILGILITFTYWYVISCLFIYLYDKYGKQKK